MLSGWLESNLVPSVSPTPATITLGLNNGAIDSVRQAQRTYQNITFSSAAIDGQRHRIGIQLPFDYINTNAAIAAEQLAKAGVHLAHLLNAIQWAVNRKETQ